MLLTKRPLVGTLLPLAAFAIYLLICTVSAKAESGTVLINLDKSTYRVAVVENEDTREFVLGPNQEVSGVCSSECLVQIEGDPEEFLVYPSDRVTIEDGQVYLLDQSDSASESDQDRLPVDEKELFPPADMAN